jgi:NitT/TauT family transport system substrate-binding protein
MTIDRRALLLTGLAAVSSAALPIGASAAELRTVKCGNGFKSVSSAIINLYIPEQIGFAKEAGLRIEAASLGTANNIMLGIDRGAVDFGVITSAFALPLLAKNELPAIKMFYEFTYPYKWDVVVKPDSPIKSYNDLRGKNIGVPNLGSSEYPVTRKVLESIGVHPDNDVKWTPVGEGLTAGLALDRSMVDALAYFDTGFGGIENAGIKMRYLPRPKSLPMIGGLFIGARADFIQKNRDLCIAYGRCVAMASEYLLANPRAGADAFAKMFPDTLPRNLNSEQAITQIVTATQRRISLYRPPYPGVKMGQIVEAELREEATFAGYNIKDYSSLYTNELIDEINNFDREKVIKQAKAFKA